MPVHLLNFSTRAIQCCVAHAKLMSIRVSMSCCRYEDGSDGANSNLLGDIILVLTFASSTLMLLCVYRHVYRHVCVDMCVNMCVGMCVGMCADMYVGAVSRDLAIAIGQWRIVQVRSNVRSNVRSSIRSNIR